MCFFYWSFASSKLSFIIFISISFFSIYLHKLQQPVEKLRKKSRSTFQKIMWRATHFRIHCVASIMSGWRKKSSFDEAFHDTRPSNWNAKKYDLYMYSIWLLASFTVRMHKSRGSSLICCYHNYLKSKNKQLSRQLIQTPCERALF